MLIGDRLECPSCGSEDVVVVVDFDSSGPEFSVRDRAHCRACGLESRDVEGDWVVKGTKNS